MFKRLIAGSVLVASFVALTGCANRTNVDVFPDLTQTDNLITKGEATSQNVREIFGAPTFIGETASDGKTVYGYSVDSASIMTNFGSNLGKSFLTLGFGSKTYPRTVKSIYFKFNNDKVEDIKYLGYAFVHKARFKNWAEGYNELTLDEYKSHRDYSTEEIYDMYKRKLAAKKGVDLSQITDDELHAETPTVNFQKLNIEGCKKVFNDEVTVLDDKPAEQSYDKVKSFLIFK